MFGGNINEIHVWKVVLGRFGRLSGGRGSRRTFRRGRLGTFRRGSRRTFRRRRRLGIARLRSDGRVRSRRSCRRRSRLGRLSCGAAFRRRGRCQGRGRFCGWLRSQLGVVAGKPARGDDQGDGEKDSSNNPWDKMPIAHTHRRVLGLTFPLFRFARSGEEHSPVTEANSRRLLFRRSWAHPRQESRTSR